MTSRFASRMSRVQPSAIRELLRLGGDPDIISFGGGYPLAAKLVVNAGDVIITEKPTFLRGVDRLRRGSVRPCSVKREPQRPSGSARKRSRPVTERSCVGWGWPDS